MNPDDCGQPVCNSCTKSSSCVGGPNTEPPAPASTSKKFPLWGTVLIVLGTVILGLVVFAVVDSVKKKKKSKLL